MLHFFFCHSGLDPEALLNVIPGLTRNPEPFVFPRIRDDIAWIPACAGMTTSGFSPPRE
jgi:hypothetical protein